jgi:hypothetical protein
MKNKINIYQLQTNTYPIRYKEYDGKQHIIIPVVMMKEGVHSGSRGPLLHIQEELEKFTASWNGIPVMVGHPERNGNYVSANDPEVSESERVGTIFNTYYEDGLKSEAWLDVEKLKKRSPELLNKLREGKSIDVSIGVFSDEEDKQGQWNGEDYISVARNYRPDHLAILPDEIGACSFEDGCGIRVNKKGETKLDLSTYVSDKGFKVLQNEKEISLCDMFKVFIENKDEEFLTKFKEKFEEFVPVNKKEVNKGENMAKEKVDAKVIDSLIQSNKNTFAESDREALSVFSESQINKILAMEEKMEKQENKKVTEEEIKGIVANTYKSFDDLKKVLPAEFVKQVEYGIQSYNDKKAKLVENITANSKVFTKEELETKEIGELEKLNSFVQDNKETDFSGQVAGGTNFNVNNGIDEEVMLPVGIDFKKGDK